MSVISPQTPEESSDLRSVVTWGVRSGLMMATLWLTAPELLTHLQQQSADPQWAFGHSA